MTTLAHWADVRQTSLPVAKAIWEHAGNGCEGTAERIWSNPTPEEIANIEARAWQLADPDDDILHWGVTAIKRPS